VARVVLDMRTTIPFDESVENHRGIDQSCEYAPEEDDQNEIAKRPGQTKTPKSEHVD
jgi:hypothetical protein